MSAVEIYDGRNRKTIADYEQQLTDYEREIQQLKELNMSSEAFLRKHTLPNTPPLSQTFIFSNEICKFNLFFLVFC